jgi:hypothetical protein
MTLTDHHHDRQTTRTSSFIHATRALLMVKEVKEELHKLARTTIPHLSSSDLPLSSSQ